jgi:3-dehydroquinate dehydratase-1
MRLGTLELGTMPRIVAAATDRDLADTGWAGLADCIELRVDQFADPTPAAARNAAERARRIGKPLIGTVRCHSEGGAQALDDAQRLALYDAIAPHVDGLDVELRAPICDRVVGLARGRQLLAIVSAHFVDATPADAVLHELLADSARRGDVAKFAAPVHGDGDLQRLRELLRAPGPPRIVIGMGSAGADSRVDFPLLGSLLTYSFATAPSAPGQLALPDLYDALRQRSPAFAASHPARSS